MRVQRAALLGVLEMLTPGLSNRETVAQSSCIVFTGEKAMTFNEEIFASTQSPLPGLTGAVKAKTLLDLLSKMQDDADVDVEQKGKELVIKAANSRRAGIKMEQEVLLPIDAVEQPTEWRDLHPDFCDAISVAYPCAGLDSSKSAVNKFVLSCVHIHPEYIQACDRFQIVHYPMATGMQTPILLRAESIKKILGCDMTQVSETKSWIHFRNPKGLVVTLRRFIDDYPSLADFINIEGSRKTTLPGAIEEVVKRAEVFTAENAGQNNVVVSLTPDYIIIAGEGPSGWYKERKAVVYQGEPMEFMIRASLLTAITKRSQDCFIGTGRLCVDTGKFKYITCTIVPKAATGKEGAA